MLFIYSCDSQDMQSQQITMRKEIQLYHNSLETMDKDICTLLANTIDRELGGENKIWHGHPVWFLEGNPIVGYCKLPWGKPVFDKGMHIQTGYGRASVAVINLDYRVNK